MGIPTSTSTSTSSTRRASSPAWRCMPRTTTRRAGPARRAGGCASPCATRRGLAASRSRACCPGRRRLRQGYRLQAEGCRGLPATWNLRLCNPSRQVLLRYRVLLRLVGPDRAGDPPALPVPEELDRVDPPLDHGPGYRLP